MIQREFYSPLEPQNSRTPEPPNNRPPERPNTGIPDPPNADGVGSLAVNAGEVAHPPLSSDRRRFLVRLSLGFSGVAALLIGVPFIGFLVAPVRHRIPDVWRSIGSIGDFITGQTVKATYMDPAPLPWAGFSAESAVWVRRTGERTFEAFSMYCTHTGCPVAWVENADLFFCPCHGGAFYRDGSVAAGPPPRPLERHETRIRNGQVEVRAGRVPLPPPGA